MALAARLDHLNYNTYVSSATAKSPKARLGSGVVRRRLQAQQFDCHCGRQPPCQSQATAFGHDIGVYRKRFEALAGASRMLTAMTSRKYWKCSAGRLNDSRSASSPKPTRARRFILQDKDGWHGKPLNQEEAAKAIAELQPSSKSGIGVPIPRRPNCPRPTTPRRRLSANQLQTRRPVATREAYGTALARIGETDQRIVALDGDTKNSTYADKFFKKFPDRSIECFIAEQNMVGMATGFGARGKVPFASTFACFFTARMTRFASRHFAGEPQARRFTRRREHRRRRPVANALEDIAMMRAVVGSVVLYPSDAVSTEKLLEQMAQKREFVSCAPRAPKRR